MLVVVLGVRRVLVPVVHVVDVVVVGDGLVTASVAVRVLGKSMLGHRLMLVVVVTVKRVMVRAVNIVDMVSVGHRLVTAVSAVRVLVDAVLSMRVCRAHCFLLLDRGCYDGSARFAAVPSGATDSLTWMRASLTTCAT